jgi:PAS domain S-box-containing protein
MGILLAFAAVIRFHLFNSALARDYSSGGWLAFSSNLIFLSVVIVLLIQRIFQNLQRTIKNKDQLQEKYKSIFQLSPVPMWLFDPESLAFLDVNEAAINHYGYTREEFLAMTIRDIRMGSDVKKVEEVAKTNAVTGMYYNGRAEHIKKNGEKIYVNIESNLLDLDGNKARLVLANDITPQLLNRLEVVNANIKLKQSLINLSAIFESTANGIVLLDEHYNIKLFNLKAANYIKFSTGKLEFEIGRSIFDYIEVIRQAYLKTLFKKVYAGETIEFDRKYRRPNKLTYWIHYTITPVYEESTVKGFCIAGRDVTARKTYVKFVEEQNRVFREISWMQSHVVRAPLARIMGLAALLEHEKDEAEKAEILKHLDESSRELDGIIHDIVSKSANIVEKFPKD